jgi:peptide chain release factor 2
LQEKCDELELKMTNEDFWSDPDSAQKILKQSKMIKSTIEDYEKLEIDYEEVSLLAEMAMEEEDASIGKEVAKSVALLVGSVDQMMLRTLLSGEYDQNSAILSIHAGTGGRDAQDWAELLMRMYRRWADKQGFGVTVLDILTDTEAGIKSVTLLIEGLNAYGFLRSEKGVHRLVRISPFDSSGKRHTSFASVDVMPELDDDIDINLDPTELKIDTYRSSGAGGQHVNTTDSAIRITHLPTGIVVTCQNQRSQLSNKNTAMKMLMAKLIELKELEQKEKIEDLQGDYSQIAWGSQIRSYVFHPYTMVKDHRTNAESGNIQSVMDGDIDLFINEYLRSGV